MVQTEKVDKQFIADLVAKTAYNETLLAKDYYITRILYLLKDVKGIYFKGGTALQKIFLDHERLSEDIDFTLTHNVKKKEQEIITLLGKQEFIKRITKDKDVDGFVRVVVHYDNLSGEEDTIFIDLNERGKLLTKPETHIIKHFYPDIPSFTISTLSKEEMVAEKVAAAIGRNKPRDHYDIYQILKRNISLDMKLVELKCRQSGYEFNIIKMFSNAKKLKNRWDEDMVPLLPNPTPFPKVMRTLARHFKLKEEKDQQKKR
ncbi:nucleotidyl transferase AbiEii/AbiGii toxin family protein [Candidatus Woesearchaeota archaeon]|nr:nucleotidyl transferase AbiEii/AbiGii toxin family protein [Candidatus Woesearchaeota archaeon]